MLPHTGEHLLAAVLSSAPFQFNNYISNQYKRIQPIWMLQSHSSFHPLFQLYSIIKLAVFASLYHQAPRINSTSPSPVCHFNLLWSRGLENTTRPHSTYFSQGLTQEPATAPSWTLPSCGIQEAVHQKVLVEPQCESPYLPSSGHHTQKSQP